MYYEYWRDDAASKSLYLGIGLANIILCTVHRQSVWVWVAQQCQYWRIFFFFFERLKCVYIYIHTQIHKKRSCPYNNWSTSFAVARPTDDKTELIFMRSGDDDDAEKSILCRFSTRFRVWRQSIVSEIIVHSETIFDGYYYFHVFIRSVMRLDLCWYLLRVCRARAERIFFFFFVLSSDIQSVSRLGVRINALDRIFQLKSRGTEQRYMYTAVCDIPLHVCGYLLKCASRGRFFVSADVFVAENRVRGPLRTRVVLYSMIRFSPDRFSRRIRLWIYRIFPLG